MKGKTGGRSKESESLKEEDMKGKIGGTRKESESLKEEERRGKPQEKGKKVRV
jgi:hypothetical protein